MVRDKISRRRNRPRKRKVEPQSAPKKKRNYKWIVLIAFGMAFLGAIAGLAKDFETAIALGIIGLVLGGIGGAAILLGDDLPARKGTDLASRNYLGGNDMPDVDDILK